MVQKFQLTIFLMRNFMGKYQLERLNKISRLYLILDQAIYGFLLKNAFLQLAYYTADTTVDNQAHTVQMEQNGTLHMEVVVLLDSSPQTQ